MAAAAALSLYGRYITNSIQIIQAPVYSLYSRYPYTHTHTHTHTKIRQSHNPQTGERSGHQLTATRGESHFGEAATHRHMLKITVS